MAALLSQIIDKYHGVASKQVINAVEKAAAKTGADFSFLMEKASAESSFNPSAKSKTSTATGLFQFIESTWLNMVKEHGAKYGLSALADHIQNKGGKLCVDDCKVKDAILRLRTNPEIAALMAGEFSSGNKQYLEAHTDGAVGSTEMYIAHFMGAGGATKFLNSRYENGGAVAANLFPKEAAANKNVFFDSATGKARTLNEIYDFFARKFDGGTPSSPPSAFTAEKGSTPTPAPPASPSMPSRIAQALLSFNDTDNTGAISWNNYSAYKSGFAPGSSPLAQKISAESIMLMAQMHRHPSYNS